MNFKQPGTTNLRISNRNVFIFLIMNITILFTFYLIYNLFYSPSISLHLILHKYINNKVFIQINIFFYKHFNNEYLFYCILILVYNYSNIYKSFILYIIFLISKFISGFLQLLFTNYPLYYNEAITYLYIENYNYSFPSESLIFFPIFSHLTWKILTKKISKKKMNQKKILIFILTIYNIFIPLNQFILGLLSISEIIFSLFFSYIIYYFLYYVLKINFSNSNQFFKIIRSKIRNISIILIFLFVCELFIYEINYKEEKLILEELKKQNKTKEKPNYLTYSDYSFIRSLPFYSIFFAFLGFKYELQYICYDKYNNWVQFNFENDESSNDNSFSSGSSDLSLMERISITKGTQWNHTDKKISIMRLFTLLYFIFLIIIPGYFISWNNPFFIMILFKEFIPWCIISFGGTYAFKVLFKKLGLINLTLETMLRESI